MSLNNTPNKFSRLKKKEKSSQCVTINFHLPQFPKRTRRNNTKKLIKNTPQHNSDFFFLLPSTFMPIKAYLQRAEKSVLH